MSTNYARFHTIFYQTYRTDAILPDMNPRYDFLTLEPQAIKLWENHEIGNPDSVISEQDTEAKPKNGKSFSMIMPPPNANNPLHVGHAMFISLEDALIRYHRMIGDDTAWIPGTDHAGIETQFLYEKKLQKEGKSRFNFDRQTLYKNIWDYVKENSEIAIDQTKRLGSSADWSRFKFTLDEDIVAAVLQTFQKLHADDLVYRDLKLVNYCTKCGTSYSELEVKHEDRQVPLYYMKYGPFVLATTRPETKFGDTAVAVHPDDKRYQDYIGQIVEVEGLNGPFSIKVIADEFVDPEFGTGVVKITPAHDFADFEVWQRHKDEIPGLKQVIGFDGKLTDLAGTYEGQSVEQARKQISTDLQAKGLIDKIDTNYTTSIGTCYRCSRVLEPLPMAQFFIKVRDSKHNLSAKALAALDTGETKIHGAGREKILRHWLENLRDWNISRQIAWGIRIPVWYQVDGYENQITISFVDPSGNYTQGMLQTLLQQFSFEDIISGLQQVSASISVPYSVSINEPESSESTKLWIKETDTFDTWFSSAQWPVITLKSEKAGDFDRFYPTTVMETGYDILPFWVMRMMLLGIYLTDKSPFSHVYLHGLVRDEKGQKMSKSKGNVTNPLEVVQQYGADALRMALVIRSTPGIDKSVGDPDFKAMRNFANKIWNASRFVLQNQASSTKHASEGTADKDFDTHLNTVIGAVSQQLSDLRPGLAADTIYNEFWHWYCDQMIEESKTGALSRAKLLKGLMIFLKLLHPFMPFVTESIWQEAELQNATREPLLALASWPTPMA